MSIRIYQTAADYAETRGIIIADTKFEFGHTAGKLVSRRSVHPVRRVSGRRTTISREGGSSFDKQYVRDYLEAIKWNKQPPAPLPPEVAARTSEKYVEAYTQMTGHPLPA